MPALGCIKITGQASRLTIRTNVYVYVYRRTINTVEKRANDVLLATTPRIRKMILKYMEEPNSLEALDTGVLNYQKERVWVSTDKKAYIYIAATYAVRPNCLTL